MRAQIYFSGDERSCNDLTKRFRELEAYKTDELVTVCKSGGRGSYSSSNPDADGIFSHTCDEGRHVDLIVTLNKEGCNVQ